MTTRNRHRLLAGPLVLVVALSAAVVAAVVAAGVARAAAVGAEGVTATELAELSRRAASDPEALDRLRGVDSVDGRAVDVATALRGAAGADLAARLEQLAAGAAAGSTLATTPAAENPGTAAATILAGDRFQPAAPPRASLFKRLGQVARPVLRPVGRLLGLVFGPIGRFVARGFQSATGAVLWGVVILAAVVLVAVLAVRRRAALALTAGSGSGLFDERDDPRRLERQADEAAAAGDHRLAVRLRFRAGLVRLHGAGLSIRPTMTTGQLAAVIDDATFVGLGRVFDGIAYGGRAADAGDDRRAEEAWAVVLASANGKTPQRRVA